MFQMKISPGVVGPYHPLKKQDPETIERHTQPFKVSAFPPPRKVPGPYLSIQLVLKEAAHLKWEHHFTETIGLKTYFDWIGALS